MERPRRVAVAVLMEMQGVVEAVVMVMIEIVTGDMSSGTAGSIGRRCGEGSGPIGCRELGRTIRCLSYGEAIAARQEIQRSQRRQR